MESSLLKTEASNYQALGTIFEKEQPQVEGQRFALFAQLKTPNDECVDAGCGGCFSDPRGIIIYPMILIGLPIGAVALFVSGYVGYGLLCLVPWVLMIVLFVYCCGLCKSKGEEWLKYVLIINIEAGKLFIIEESTLKRWKLTTIIPLDQMRSISAKWEKRTHGLSKTENAYVVIKLSRNRAIRMNNKSAKIMDVKHFVAKVDEYFEKIGNQYRNAASAITMNDIDGALRRLIRSLKSSSDNEIKRKGMKLDHWYEMKKVAIVNEFIDLLRQTHQNENKWTDLQRDQYIVDMLMLKCETLESITVNEKNFVVVDAVEK